MFDNLFCLWSQRYIMSDKKLVFLNVRQKVSVPTLQAKKWGCRYSPLFPIFSVLLSPPSSSHLVICYNVSVTCTTYTDFHLPTQTELKLLPVCCVAYRVNLICRFTLNPISYSTCAVILTKGLCYSINDQTHLRLSLRHDRLCLLIAYVYFTVLL